MDKYTIKAVIRAVDQFSPVMKRMSANMKVFGKSTQKFGKSATAGMTAPIVAFGAVTLKSAVDFEKSMNRIEALSGETGQGMERMRQLALNLGSSTAFSAKQAADAMGFFAQAGWETNQVLAATPAILDLAAASNTDLARSADIASNIMGQFGIPAKEASRVADVLAATTASANVDMEMLAESFSKTGTVAKTYGLTLEDTAAAIGLLGNVGIQGSIAGTAMKNAMLAMVNPVGDAGKMLKYLGVATTDAEGNLLPLADVMTDFANGIGSLGSGDQLKAIEMLFGKISLAGANELMNQAKSGKFQEYADSLKNVEGRARSMAEILLKGAPGAMARFTSSFEGMTLAIASSGLLDWFSEILVTVTGFFTTVSKSSPTLLKWGTILAIAAAAMGPLLFGLGSIMVMASLITAPILIATAVIAALAAAAYVIYDNWDNIANWFTTKLDAVSSAFEDGFFSGIWSLFKEFNPFTLWYEYADGLLNYLFGFDLSGWFTSMFDSISQAFDNFMTVTSYLAQRMNPFPYLMETAKEFLNYLVNTDLGQWMSGQVQAMLSTIPDWVKDAVGIDSVGSGPQTSSDVNKVVQASGGGINQAKADVTVDFKGLPPGARVEGKSTGSGLDLNIGRGYALGH
ncbi:MAG: phage tail tape measure protein [Halopseudomonas aestusnigri]